MRGTCLATTLTLIWTASAPGDRIQFLTGLGYIQNDELVVQIGDVTAWRGGAAVQTGSIVTGYGWETYPGGEPVLISQLVDVPQRSVIWSPPRRVPVTEVVSRNRCGECDCNRRRWTVEPELLLAR